MQQGPIQELEEILMLLQVFMFFLLLLCIMFHLETGEEKSQSIFY